MSTRVISFFAKSLLAKVDELKMELSHFDIISLSDIQDDKITFQNYLTKDTKTENWFSRPIIA